MDVGQYLDIFIDEANEHIQSLSDNIMILEKEPENKDVINEISRVVATQPISKIFFTRPASPKFSLKTSENTYGIDMIGVTPRPDFVLLMIPSASTTKPMIYMVNLNIFLFFMKKLPPNELFYFKLVMV